MFFRLDFNVLDGEKVLPPLLVNRTGLQKVFIEWKQELVMYHFTYVFFNPVSFTNVLYAQKDTKKQIYSEIPQK